MNYLILALLIAQSLLLTCVSVLIFLNFAKLPKFRQATKTLSNPAADLLKRFCSCSSLFFLCRTNCFCLLLQMTSIGGRKLLKNRTLYHKPQNHLDIVALLLCHPKRKRKKTSQSPLRIRSKSVIKIEEHQIRFYMGEGGFINVPWVLSRNIILFFERNFRLFPYLDWMWLPIW